MASLVHGTETRPDVAQKQHGNYRSVVRTVAVNFLMTYTVHTCNISADNIVKLVTNR